MNEIEITPHGFGELSREEMNQLAVLLLKAGYTDVGITRKQPSKGKPYVYTLKARRSVSERDNAQTDETLERRYRTAQAFDGHSYAVLCVQL